MPALHRPWSVALAAGFLQIVDGQAVPGPVLRQWPDADTDDDTVCELWLTGLIAAFAADSSSADEAGAAAFSRIMFGVLATDPPPSVVVLWERARKALMFEHTFLADPFFSAYYRYGDPLGGAPDLLIKFGPPATFTGWR